MSKFEYVDPEVGLHHKQASVGQGLIQLGNGLARLAEAIEKGSVAMAYASSNDIDLSVWVQEGGLGPEYVVDSWRTEEIEQTQPQDTTDAEQDTEPSYPGELSKASQLMILKQKNECLTRDNESLRKEMAFLYTSNCTQCSNSPASFLAFGCEEDECPMRYIADKHGV